MRLAVLTTGRQDWGILRSTCLALRARSEFELLLLAGGMHCEPRFGNTAQQIEAEGFTLVEKMRWAGESEDAAAHLQAGETVARVGEALARQRPDALLLVGDRFETAAAALAATVARVPLIHLHGGEVTEGAFDNALRHAISKLSHLHLVSHELHARRLIAMGEAPSAIQVVGAPALDNLQRVDLAERAELEAFLKLPLTPPVVLVTLHPATLGSSPEVEVEAVLVAMDRIDATYIITLPNVDPGAPAIRQRLSQPRPRRVAVEALGERRYWGLMKLADAMLGNSSSGLIEAPVVELPVVNVGDRQKGRLRSSNVLDAPPDATAITDQLQRALSPEFRATLRGAKSPLGDGHAAEKIVDLLTRWRPPRPPVKAPI